MKIGHLAALSLLMATPALADMKSFKSHNGVDAECAITGSDNTGWSIYGINTTKVKKSCTVKCDLTKKSGGIHRVEAKARSVRESATRFEMNGDVPAKIGPFTAAKITEATCPNS